LTINNIGFRTKMAGNKVRKRRKKERDIGKEEEKEE
jgi:hypothetical protein